MLLYINSKNESLSTERLIFFIFGSKFKFHLSLYFLYVYPE